MAGERPKRPKPPPDPRASARALPTRPPPLLPYDEGETTGPVDVTPTKAQPMPSAIVVVIKPAAAMPGHRYLLLKNEHTLGRKLDNDIALDVTSVSRKHARFVRHEDGGWFVEDLKSTNGTFVNEEPVVGRRRMRDGDQIKLGEAVLRFLAGTNIEAQYHEEIYRLAILDGLTGVHNKRFFNEVLEREVAHCYRHGSGLSLVLFDIDRFKLVNDTHGHPAGDAVLQQLCARLKSRIRKDDMLARIGGEEFGALLVDTPRDGAVRFAELIRQLVEREAFTYEGKQIHVTISLGVDTIPAAGAGDRTGAAIDGDELFKRADARLYEAKGTGRNRVVG